MGSLGPFELVILMLIFLIGPVLFVASIVWVYRDAEARGSNGLMVAIFAGLLWPLSIPIWFFIRPSDRD